MIGQWLCCRNYDVRIPREEVIDVESLRQKWDDLLELADQVRDDLLKEKRNAFEQELDKQVKVSIFFIRILLLLLSAHGMGSLRQ